MAEIFGIVVLSIIRTFTFGEVYHQAALWKHAEAVACETYAILRDRNSKFPREVAEYERLVRECCAQQSR